MRSALILLLCLVGLLGQAQQRFGFSFYDVDHLYDTIPSPFYDDLKYTPTGTHGWDSSRYHHKIQGVCSTIDSMRMPIVGLYGVESEDVVRDIVMRSELDYSYIHRTQNAFDGMDFCLLYYADLFEPKYVESGRQYMYVEGVLRDGREIGLLLSNDKSIHWTIKAIRQSRKVPLVVAGRSDRTKPEAFSLSDASLHAQTLGRGNIRYSNGWQMRHRILIDKALDHTNAEVFIREELLDSRTKSPKATYVGKRYTAGRGRMLPIYIYIE